MLQCRLIHDTCLERLEGRINGWMQGNPTKKVLNLSVHVAHNSAGMVYRVCIQYDDK